MNLLSLAAIPAATTVARGAIAGSAQVGQGFLSLLSNLKDAANPKSDEAGLASADKTAVANPDSISARTASFAQKLAKWLRQQPGLSGTNKGDGALAVELSLDQLDRPHATLAGQPSADLDAALASDPSWLDEFRRLALDRVEQMGPVQSNSPLQSLTIEQQSATMDAEHRWN